MNKIIALVGMAGAGKSVAAEMLRKLNYPVVRFGDATEDYLKREGMVVNEKNEKAARELLRKRFGMAAYAVLNKSRLSEHLKKGSVVADGLYSWEEYVYLRKEFDDNLVVIAIYCSPATRYKRLKVRPIRPLTPEEGASRDAAEIENINKAGPIVMADHTLINEGNLKELEKQLKRLVGTF